MTDSTTETYELVVAGSGGAALTAAHLAAKAGLTTAVLERTGLVGGTSAYSGGACWLPGSAVQRRAGIADSSASARHYLDAVLHGPRPELVESFLAYAPTLVDALTADPDFDFEWLPFPEYFAAPGRVAGGRSIQPVAIDREQLSPTVAALVRPPVERDRVGRPGRSRLTGGQALVARLLAMLVRDGGTVCTGHRVSGLCYDGDRVTGVLVEAAGATIEIRATRGVLLACGGFEGNTELRVAHGVPGAASWSMAPPGTNAGELLRAAVRLGAATAHLDQAWLCPGLLQPDGRASFTLGFRGGVMVDAAGRRYANECLPYDRFGRQMAARDERLTSWLVFDSREGGRLPAIAMPEGDPGEHLAAGTWVSAVTIEELSARMRVDTETLRTTVDRFNDAARVGVDGDFGRGADEYDTFFAAGGRPNPALVPIDRPPYFAARFVLSDLGTKGGLVTDAAARVLRTDGSVISGLYAAGNTAASLSGDTYPAPGIPLGTGMVAAALAVRDLTRMA
ncbi:MAG TPA: FAD-dependent oxidoreductase [Rugosimonospora sp.]|nr:FAD-dependent oxidoreductase [Rugosimonospora sp.]